MNTRLQTRPLPHAGVPGPPPPAAPAPDPPPGDVRGHDLLVGPLVVLLIAAVLPLGRVFVGWGFLRPVVAAVLIIVGLSWACRRVGWGPVPALAVSALGWAAFVVVVFLRDTAVLGVVPTPRTLEGFGQLWTHGFQLIATRPPPTFAEPSLLLLTVTGIWALTHAVDGIVFRLGSPVKALLPALGLWLVPLLLTVGEGSPGAWSVPVLVASALLVAVATSTDVGRWGQQVRAPSSRRATGALRSLIVPGTLIAGVAITAGVLLAGTLPGYDDPPWYEFGGVGGTTLTTNPIVSIRPSLLSDDQGPVMTVTTERPVYLRTTALDVYSPTGEWTNAGIRGAPVSGAPGQTGSGALLGPARAVDVAVEVTNLPGAVLVPAPYYPRAVTGPAATDFQFDRRLATLTTDRGATLEPGDRYSVSAAVPDPDPDTLRALQRAAPEGQLQLPANVPAPVIDLARDIVQDAGAQAHFDQALAIQQEFQSGRWTYSLDPPQGHSGDAMLAFLDSRVGYCEQYAGTMAVMLRTLGIPARVAVGFTPGEQRADDVYAVTNGNAHAWVEVFFPDHGWLAFEPTPRDDGNVLPPSAETLAPELTVHQQSLVEPVELPDAVPDEPALPEEQAAVPDRPVDEPAAEAAGEAGASGIRWVLGVLAALAAAGGLAGVAHRRGRLTAPPTALARVLHAREHVARVGRGLGIGAVSSETDREYLQRLTAATSAPRAPATATALADRVAQARYAPRVPAVVAEEAEAAAGALRGFLLAGRSGPARAAILLRGTASAWAARLRAVVASMTDRLRRR